MDNDALGIVTDYEAAVNYYAKLKEQMLDEVFDSFMKKSGHIDTQTKNNLQTQIEQATSLNYKGAETLSTKVLGKVEKYAKMMVKNLVGAKSEQYQQLLQEINNEKTKLMGESRKVKRDAYKKMIEKKRAVMQSLLNPQKLWAQINNKTYGMNVSGADKSDIQNQIYSYLNFYAMELMTESDFDANPWNRARIVAGYYRELSEYQALSNLIGKNMVHHAGAKKIKTSQGTVDSPLDIMISSLETEAQRLNNVEYVNQLFADTPITEASASELMSTIDVYGEQVKSWSFQKKLPSDGYFIGNRKDLLSAYLSTGGSPYDYRSATAFLGKLRSILISLGPQNVLFSTGNQRFWMDDFIKTFRQQGLLLTFEPEKDRSIGQHVILDRLIMARGKTVKMRKKYS